MAKKTITIKDPLDCYMDKPQEESTQKPVQEPVQETVQQGFTAVKKDTETKKKRVQLLIYPSLHEAAAAKAAAQGVSFNEYVNQALEYVLKGK